jgi:hypothetical protein
MDGCMKDGFEMKNGRWMDGWMDCLKMNIN